MKKEEQQTLTPAQRSTLAFIQELKQRGFDSDQILIILQTAVKQ